MKVSSFLSLLLALGVGAVGGWYGREQLDPHPPIAVVPDPPGSEAEEPPPAPPEPAEPVAAAQPPPPAAPEPLSLAPEQRAEAFQRGSHVTIDLLYALEDHLVEAEFKGNGRDPLKMVAMNRAMQPVRLSFPMGQAFESVHGTVVLMRPLTLDLLPGEMVRRDLETMALSSAHWSDTEALFAAVSQPPGDLLAMLEYLAAHPEIAPPVAQTATLAIRENLPASAFARFAQEGALPAELNTDFFKVETVELVQALILLRNLGYTGDALAITIDPLTKIEAMIDPLAHAFALQYYGIEPGAEWAYWKKELQEGNVKTRHYALYGIARYYPDVALQMMPQWVRERRTPRLLRHTAAQALSVIPRPEALVLLNALKEENADDAELSRTLARSIDYLDALLKKAAPGEKIGFRLGLQFSEPSPTGDEESPIAPEIAESREGGTGEPGD